MAIKIIIADDHQLFREGLVKLLSNTNDIEILNEAENGQEAINNVEKYLPDIVLMDIGMPIINGIEATRIIKERFPETKVIALSMHDGKEYIKDILEAGAAGYLLKSCTYSELTEAIKTIYKGSVFLSKDVTEIVIKDYLNKEEPQITTDENLSKRELEVLKLYAEGNSTREISEKLFISIKTVGTHKQHIFEKLEINSTAEMIKYALKKKIVSL